MRMMLILLLIVIATASFASGDVTANYDVKGEVSFQAEVDLPGFDFKGTGGKFSGKASETAGVITATFKVPVKDFDTAGNVPNLFNLRNKHMLAHIESDKFPEASLEVTKYVMGEESFEGKLTFHGVTNPVTGKMAVSAGLFTASFTIDITMFGMKQPSNAGATVDKMLPFEIKGEFKKI